MTGGKAVKRGRRLEELGLGLGLGFKGVNGRLLKVEMSLSLRFKEEVRSGTTPFWRDEMRSSWEVWSVWIRVSSSVLMSFMLLVSSLSDDSVVSSILCVCVCVFVSVVEGDV